MSRVVPATAVAALALVTAGGSAAGSPQAHAARTCHLSAENQRGLGASYVGSLNVRHTSCGKGKKVVKAYQHCRAAHGWRGKCRHRVKGYKCKRHIRESSSVQYDATVTCKRGGKRVVHTYTENK